MTTMEIALLIVGVIIFVISFLMPDVPRKKTEKELAAEKEEVKRLVAQEVDGMKLRVNEATNDSVEYAVDKAERSLEKVSNEKIMAVNEYAGTILEEINKNHREVMFLYDMLRDKQDDLTNTVRRADAAAKEIEVMSINAQNASETLLRGMSVASVSQKGLTAAQKSVFDNLEIPDAEPVVFTPKSMEAVKEQMMAESFAASQNNVTPAGTQQIKKTGAVPQNAEAKNAEIKNAEMKNVRASQPEVAQQGAAGIKSLTLSKHLTQSKIEADLLGISPKEEKSLAKVITADAPSQVKEKVVYDILSGGAYKEGNLVNVDAPAKGSVTAADLEAMNKPKPVIVEGEQNNNDKILALAKQGFDTVAIAKSLGLGVGEVKLVIDLFQ